MHKPGTAVAVLMTGAVLAIGGAIPSVAGGAGPRIDMAEMQFDFGAIPSDRNVEHVFKVKNTGDRPLVITSVQTSCGCTAAMMESSVIEPNGSGNLRVSFNPKGARGPIRKSVTISSNDPQRKSLVVMVSASPQPEALLDKPVIQVKRTHEKRERLDFDGKCAQCHVPKKAGLTGKKLYISACAMCHGDSGGGMAMEGEELGPPLKIGGSRVRTAEGMTQVITEGTGHPWMPGFGAEYGGPLSRKQVASLVKLIKNKFKEK